MICLLFVIPTHAQDSDTIVTQVYTHHHASGNRNIEGTGTFPNVNHLVFPLYGLPVWVIGTIVDGVVDGAPQFVIVHDTGRIDVVDVVVDDVTSLSRTFPPAAPPVYSQRSDTTWSLDQGIADSSPLSHPMAIGSSSVYIAANGDLVLWRDDSEVHRLELNIQPDARLVVNSSGQIAVYAEATDGRYVHGIMGDDLEGSALVIVEIVDSSLQVTMRVDLQGEDVFEGLSPIWADVDEDGIDDLITTVSNGSLGAQIRVYTVNHDGQVSFIPGPAIGQGFRWRHQLVWGAFGPNGEMELVDVLTPHIGGIVEFMRYDGERLVVVESLSGYTSHVIGSRNLDMAVAGDFNGDGQLEIVLPNQQRDSLSGIQHTANGAQVMWTLPLNGTLSSNLSAITLPDGRLGLAAGTSDNRLHVWLPVE